MKTRHLLLVLPLCGLLTAGSCKKEAAANDDYIVRENNQEFGAYLNGQPWKPNYRDAGNGTGPIDVAMFDDYLPGLLPHYNYMWITGRKANERIEIYIPPPLVPGRVLLNKTTYPYPVIGCPPAYGLYTIYSPAKDYMTNINVTGYIDIISADTLRRTIEGRFEFEAINTSTNEKINISKGYFKK